MAETALIIGAGPAGLTAALEFQKLSEIKPVVLEASHEIGGISRTIRYKGNRMDIGGHRFFSKSDRVMEWWLEQMPTEAGADNAAAISYQNQSRSIAGMGDSSDKTAEEDDLVMLIRPRKSRIYFLRRFFDYPITLTKDTLEKLGLARTAKVGISYMASRIAQIKPEKSLEDFLINRFGRQLYLTFFKSYTEKVWGTPCEEISAEWGAQRIKGLSLTTAVKHFFKKAFTKKESKDLSQKGTDTSLIERFLYPKFGPGQLWEHVADKIVSGGGDIHMGWKVDRVVTAGQRILSVEAINDAGETQAFPADHFFSTMPMRDLVNAMERGGTAIPQNVKEVSEGLIYRDFITIGLLIDKLSVTEPDGGLLKDTWIYIQEPDVLVGRLQIFNNWSPYLVEPGKIWIGLEYFCYETDPLWTMPDDDLKKFGAMELEKIGILKADGVLDAHVVRVPKTYPAYFGTYDRFEELRAFTDSFENLFLVGRNGMHKYNNQDHSMLTAMQAVENVIGGVTSKKNLWKINTEMEYHEEKGDEQEIPDAEEDSMRSKVL
ncbi:NAD(P)/FAD-dependent oxidoreductase [Terriglobus saanensis]|uniref:Amine oxidase n=1 Tax=Terriglobus saanensis (strain ATCC BAA-1853 / DSM 23119 / SP1PR4) TaxID=401053 RepID=E8V3L6_TERSS|nr:NAD(P)/FAD-dependent oxidoreductase [Terriglobus saanensis]ADV84703.1 amine oxidase [Terriglobus saanensis SP1PR4]